MRIALFGGSFNPIHVGHTVIASTIVNQGLADEVWLMISPQNPLKQQADLAPENLRLNWTKQALRDLSPAIKACDYEFHLPRPSFTYLTLRQLRKDYPLHKFLLCIGADNWACFPQWRYPEEILTHHEIIIYPRLGSTLTEPLPDGVHLLNCKLVNVSSTEIRQRLSRNESIEGLVPQSLIPTLLSQEWKKS